MIALPPSPPVPPAPPSQNGHIPADEALMGGDPLEYVSVSRLKSFLGCRLRFYYEKVLAKKMPSLSEGGKDAKDAKEGKAEAKIRQ